MTGEGRRAPPGGPVLPALAILLALGACAEPEPAEAVRRSDGGGGDAAVSSETPSPPAAEVPAEVAVEAGEELRYTLPAESRLVTEKEVDVVARTTGLLEHVWAELGDSVAEGEPLAQFERREEELVHEAATAELARARGILKRRERLLEQELVPREEYENARHDVEVAEARYELADFRLAQTEVKAPFAGTITERLAREGMYILEENTVPLFRITGDGPVEARAYLPEWSAPYLHQGARVEIVPQFGGAPLEGRLAWISPVVDPVAGTVEVRVHLVGRSSVPKGSAVVLNFPLVSDPGRPTVSRSSLLEPDPQPGGLATVLVRGEKGRWKPQQVRLGLVEDHRAEVRQGLQAGDRIRAVVPRDELARRD